MRFVPSIALLVLLLVSGCSSLCDGFWLSGPDRDYLGLMPEDAGNLAEARGLRWRVISRDGESIGMTLDLDPNRLDFCVNNDLVVGVQRSDSN